jgi:HipA-like protein
MFLKIDKITAIDVYAEFGKSRILVGRLNKIKDKFQFTYDRKYLKSEKKLSLGPEFPMTKIRFFSDSLFNSFKDRIPSKENPAYSEYCEKFGVSSDENNELILLATIGSRGPSSFVFEPVFDSEFTAVDLAAFRKKLKLSIRDFAILFDFSYATLNKIENGKMSGRDILKRIEIYALFKETAFFEIERNKAKVHSKVYESVKTLL